MCDPPHVSTHLIHGRVGPAPHALQHHSRHIPSQRHGQHCTWGGEGSTDNGIQLDPDIVDPVVPGVQHDKSVYSSYSSRHPPAIPDSRDDSKWESSFEECTILSNAQVPVSPYSRKRQFSACPTSASCKNAQHRNCDNASHHCRLQPSRRQRRTNPHQPASNDVIVSLAVL